MGSDTLIIPSTVGPGISPPYRTIKPKAFVPSGLLPVPPGGHVVTKVPLFNDFNSTSLHVRSGAVRVGSTHPTSVVATKVAGTEKATRPPLFAAIGFTTTVTGSGSVLLVALNRIINRPPVAAVSVATAAPNTRGKGTVKTTLTTSGPSTLHGIGSASHPTL